MKRISLVLMALAVMLLAGSQYFTVDGSTRHLWVWLTLAEFVGLFGVTAVCDWLPFRHNRWYVRMMVYQS